MLNRAENNTFGPNLMARDIFSPFNHKGLCAAGDPAARALDCFLVASPTPGFTMTAMPAFQPRNELPYIDPHSSDSPGRERCTLDLYLPKSPGPFPVVVWFHGGGLTGGDKAEAAFVAAALARQGIGLIAPAYRLSPHISFPAYVQDAALAVSWVMKNLSGIGADSAHVFVGGHSAGGYLAALLAMDVRFLEAVGVRLSEIAGFICVSAQVMTHFTVRAERGIPQEQVVCDEAAPAYFTRKDTRPILLAVADDDLPARLEENAFFAASLRAAGNERVSFEIIPGRNHASIVDPMDQPDDPLARLIGKFVESH